MFGVGKKKEEPGEDGEESTSSMPAPEQEQKQKSAGPATLAQLSAEVDKLGAQFSSFYEMQKAATERFARINEQIGELRAMIMERDRASQHLEAKAAQAIDLVETIQPEKLMIEVRKSDAKTEALRANIESNEAVMTNVVNELKETRSKLGAFKGMDEVVKLNDEVKKELSQIKLIQSVVERHAAKIDTIFAEMQKAFGDYMKLSDILKSLDQTSKQLTTDIDGIKVNLREVAAKKELAAVIARVEEFEKKVGSVVNLINEKFDSLEKKTKEKVDTQLEKASKLVKGFENLAQKVPDLDKYFNLLKERANKKEGEGEESGSGGGEEKGGEGEEEIKVNVEKIKQPGEETDALKEAQQKAEEKKAAGGGILKAVKLPLFGKKTE